MNNTNLYDNLLDHELTALLSEGSELAFVEIYTRYKTVLFLHARRMVEEDDQARDVVQEIFTNLWEKKQELHFNTSLKSYLFTTVKNKILNLMMHQKHIGKHLESMRIFYNEGILTTDHAVREKELIALIESEIQRLPSKMKKIFILSRKEELSHREIANKLNISEQTVKKQIHYALKILRLKINLTLLVGLMLRVFE